MIPSSVARCEFNFSRAKQFAAVGDLLRLRKISDAEALIDGLPDAVPTYERSLASSLLLLARRQRDLAAKCLAEIQIPSTDFAARWLLARCLDLAGRPVQALAHLKTIQEQEPDSYEVNYRLGRVALKANAAREAAAAFAAALRAQPSSLPALLGKGMAEFKCGRWADAVDTMQTVLRLYPQCAEAPGYAGFAKVYLGDIDEAEALMRQALERRSNWLEARIRLGDSLIRGGKHEEAQAWLARVVADHPESAWARYFHLLAQYALSRDSKHLIGVKDALLDLQNQRDRATFLPAGIAAGWYTLGLAHVHAGDFKQAVMPLRRAVGMAPKRGRYRVQLATALFELGQFGSAISVLRDYRPTDGALDSKAALLTGLCHVELGQLAQAAQAFEQAGKSDPMNADAFVALGRTLVLMGEFALAERALAAASRINPRLPSLGLATHELESELGRPMDPGAGLASLEGFDIPEAFQLKLSDPKLNRPTSTWDGIRAHWRAIMAISRREMLARYGRNQIGYAWAVIQPLIYVGTLEIIFLIGHRRVPLGITMEQFLITGIVPVVCFFMNVEQKVTTAINANKNLLYFREVTTLNIMSAIWLLEFFTALTVMLVILLGLYLFGQHIIINDKLEVLAALLGISLLAAVLGGLFGVISLRWQSAVFFARSLNRVMFFLSGAFFYAGELPEQTRYYILLNPLFHYIEHLREGFFPSYQATYASWSYPLAFIIPGMFLLLVADRLLRGHAFEQ